MKFKRGVANFIEIIEHVIIILNKEILLVKVFIKKKSEKPKNVRNKGILLLDQFEREKFG